MKVPVSEKVKILAHILEQVTNRKLTYNHKWIQTGSLLDKREPNQNSEHSLTDKKLIQLKDKYYILLRSPLATSQRRLGL